MDGWEEQIDIDDSDLLSLPLSHPKAPSLLPCSHLNPKPPQSSARRLIPGPAGSVQAKMRGQTAPVRPWTASQADERGSEDLEFEFEFTSNPWLCALSLVGTGPVIGAIGSIGKDRDCCRVKQVVGLVSSCRPNRLGDLFVMLKDPTGSIGAFVHRKVLMDSRFCNGDIAVGCVLILRQVAVFPIWSKIYLNVTLNNVIKIIHKECGPPKKSVMTTVGDGCRNSNMQVKAGAGDEDRTILGTMEIEHDNRNLYHEEAIQEVASTNVLTRDKPMQFSSKETTRNVRFKGNLDDRFLQEFEGDFPFPKDRSNSTNHEQMSLEVLETRQTLELPSTFRVSDADRISKDKVSEPVSSLSSSTAIIHKLVHRHENKAPTNFIDSNAHRTTSDGSNNKVVFTEHVMDLDEQNLYWNRVPAISTNAGKVSDLIDGRFAYGKHNRKAIDRGLSKVPLSRQDKGKVCNGEVSSVTSQRIVVNGEKHPVSSTQRNPEDPPLTMKAGTQSVMESNGSKRPVSMAPATEWTDEQLAELFSDYQDGEDMFKLSL